MGDRIRQVERVTLRDSVAQRIWESIQNGIFAPGERLPSVQQLSRDLGVSPTPLREALIQLETLGVVRIRHGDGVFVAEGVVDSLMRPLSSLLAVDRPGLTDLVEVRKVIETACARLAAEKATEEQISHLERIVEAMAEVRNDLDAYLAQDLNLHLGIAQASGNRIFPQMLELVREVFHSELRSTVYTAGAIEKGFGYHRAVVHAIRMRDPDGAGEAMKEHLEDVRERLLDLVP